MFLWNIAVTSLVEVWIEMDLTLVLKKVIMSLPLWKCGLKCLPGFPPFHLHTVTSLVEVWIEICNSATYPLYGTVTSHVEVWIEI